MLMYGKQLTVEQRIDRAILNLMNKDRYLALVPILMLGKRTVKDAVKTARTDGLNEEYGRKFVEGLTDPELRFLILHESYHKLYRHLLTYQDMWKENARLANMACDYAINIRLKDENEVDDFATMPDCGLIDVRFRGMEPASIYRILKDEQDEDDEGEGEEGEGEKCEGEEGEGGGSGTGDEGDSGSGGFDEHDWGKAKERSAEENKEIEREIDSAIRQGALSSGKMGSGGNRELDRLLQPKVDWREALREFVSSLCAGNDFSSWRKPNRRYLGLNIYMPSGVSMAVGDLVIAIDTSGSIGGAILSQFLGEMGAICETAKPESVRVLYWDTQVCGDEKYVGEDVSRLTNSTKPKGGGGTMVECVPAYMQEHGIKPKAVVVLTDGYLGGSWGEGWGAPVLWCILDNKNARPSHGTVVHIES